MTKLCRMIESVESAEWIETDKNELAAIIYTLDTTDQSKGVVRFQKNV